jgi:hypothetical protein
MALVTCRCGEILTVTASDPDRIVCPRCEAKIRIRRSQKSPGSDLPPPVGSEFIRFYCPCGRRLKVRASEKTDAGKCPDCGRIVPIPEAARRAAAGDARAGSPADAAEVRTAELDAADLERLEQWSRKHAEADSPEPQPIGNSSTSSHLHRTLDTKSSVVKIEAGLRICPGCGKPLHISATVCRNCGAPVPKR